MKIRFMACAGFFLSASLCLLASCQKSIPPDALRLDSESLAQRRIQTRTFPTSDEAKVLAASAALLQDLGFNLDESESELGIIVGSKDRSAYDTKQVVGKILLAFVGVHAPIDVRQKMRSCVVTHPLGEQRKSIAVRVTFQRIVWDENNRISKREGLTDPAIYQEFFDKLSKSLFLEAQGTL